MIISAAELQRRYLLRITGVRDKKVYIGPEIVSLKVTFVCNLRCRYCGPHVPVHLAHTDQAQHIPWEKFIGIVQDSVELKVDQIVLTQGEPTIHPLFRDMMAYLEDQPIYIKLSTNATFPLEYCSDVIKGDHVIINFSAADRQQFLDIKGEDLFDRVVANIKHLVTLRDTIKPGFQIELVCIINTLNVNQKARMQALASELGVSINFKKMELYSFNQDVAFPEGSMEGEEKRTPDACLNGWFFMGIRGNDDKRMCYKIPPIRLGDSDNQSFKEVWFSPRMMNVRLLGKYGHLQKKFKECQTCPFYDENTQRGRALAALEKNDH